MRMPAFKSQSEGQNLKRVDLTGWMDEYKYAHRAQGQKLTAFELLIKKLPKEIEFKASVWDTLHCILNCIHIVYTSQPPKY